MSKKTIQAKIETMSSFTDNIVQVILSTEQFIKYQAGQYLQIFFAGEDFSYSIANAPLGSHQYELHIRHNSYNQALLTHMKEQRSVNLRLPFGECNILHLDKQRPIMFLAGGTGFAPVKAIIEQLLANADSRSLELFWGARSQSDLYLEKTVTRWQDEEVNFHYFSLLGNIDAESLASYVLAKHPEDLDEWQIVISGPFDMVYRIRDVFVQHGVSTEHLFSDAFSFEPR